MLVTDVIEKMCMSYILTLCAVREKEHLTYIVKSTPQEKTQHLLTDYYKSLMKILKKIVQSALLYCKRIKTY